MPSSGSGRSNAAAVSRPDVAETVRRSSRPSTKAIARSETSVARRRNAPWGRSRGGIGPAWPTVPGRRGTTADTPVTFRRPRRTTGRTQQPDPAPAGRRPTMRVFVTGASGAIGSRLVPQLIAAGHEVVGTHHSPAGADRIRTLGGRPVAVDLLDAPAVRAAVLAAGAEAIVHQATAL